MSRYKAIKHDDRKKELDRKRHRICNTVYGVYLLLIFICILIAGIYQHDPLIVGIGMIALGIISIPTAAFHIYTVKKGWKTQLRAWANDDTDVELETAIITIILIVASILPIVLGILKLFEII